ncbi:MAG: GNAT family N-acetyltransferase [Pseudobdellovibrionaceae bacterium]
MDCIFRIARPSDAQDIQGLYLELVQDSNIQVNPDSIASISNDEFNALLVGEVEGQVVATAFMTICRDVMYGDQPFAVVENVVVASSMRGSGIGTKMMDWIKVRSKSFRCTKIMLLSSSKRLEAHRFFEQCGYLSDAKRGFVNYVNR